MILSKETKAEIQNLAIDLAARFSPPELIVGCEVLSVADRDQYASNNGWIEARVGQHNQQRCRWRGQFTGVQVGDFVDVLYFATYRLFVVFGQGGTASPRPPNSFYPGPGELKVGLNIYTTIAEVEAEFSSGDQVLVGPGTYPTGGVTLEDIHFWGLDPRTTTFTHNAAGHGLTLEGNSSIEGIEVELAFSDAGSTEYAALVLKDAATAKRCSIEGINSGAGQDPLAVLCDAGSNEVIDCDLVGGGDGLAAINGAIVLVQRGQISGSDDDVRCDTSSVILLDDPTVQHNAFDVAGLGTVSGRYYDGVWNTYIRDGNINFRGSGGKDINFGDGNILRGFSANQIDIELDGSTTVEFKTTGLYVASGDDVYIGGDEAGIRQRSIDIYQTNISDHFDGGALSGNWTWENYSGFVTPANLDFSKPSQFLPYHSTGPYRSFAYYSSYVGDIWARCAPGATQGRAGLRIDDNSNNNYIELFWEEFAGLMKLRYRHASGGVVTGPTDLLGAQYFLIQYTLLRLIYSGGFASFWYGVDTAEPTFCGVIMLAWTGTQNGLYTETIGGGGGALSIANANQFDWYKQ